MRHNKGLWTIAVALALVACNREAIDGSAGEELGNDILTFDIVQETRTSLNSAYIPVWSDGDLISVISPDGKTRKFRLVSGAGTSVGTFKGALPMTSDGTYYAIYPYSQDISFQSGILTLALPQTYDGQANSFGQNANVMISSFTKTTQNPCFKNIFGLVGFPLSGTSSVKSIVLRDNDTTSCLWGNLNISIDGNEGTDQQQYDISGGSNSVKINFTTPVTLDSAQAKTFYFAVPASALSTGLSLEVIGSDDDVVWYQTSDKNHSTGRAQITAMDEISGIEPFTEVLESHPTQWSAYTNFARTSASDATIIDPETSSYPASKDKAVGIFYFMLHGSHGYDTPTFNSYTNGFRAPTASDTQSPFEIQKHIGANNYEFSSNITIGGAERAYHWGEPFLGYYLANDAWVIRKHAQMLCDAGVDFIAFDVTNHYSYIDVTINLCNIYLQMRAEGNKTPQITFLFNSQTAATVSDVYNNIYAAHPEFEPLWFKWEGKPLLLADKTQLSNATILNTFTFRRSWYLWNNQWQTPEDQGDTWFGNGVDKWPWGCCYIDNSQNPQRAGTHNGVNECAAVMPATHPISNIGRSYPVGSGIRYNAGKNSYAKTPEKGIYFKSQFAASKALDPAVLFFTGWNEWVATRFSAGARNFYYMGGQQVSNNTIFVDQYNYEFSRDIEPLKGGFGDNYYYYLCDFIRQFKGVETTPEYTEAHTISIDGRFFDWRKVESAYRDDNGDVKWRGYYGNNGNGWYGWGRFHSNTSYVNKTGRNDISVSRIASDDDNLYFYVKAAENLTGYASGETGLNLYISLGDHTGGWEGFNFRVLPTSATKATLYQTGSGWNWTVVSTDIDIAVAKKAMELAIPLSALGISNPQSFTVDFKWTDNVDLTQEYGIQCCLSDGDSAPDGRFRYRYKFNQQ